MTKELQLFIIWNNGRNFEKEILTDISAKFEIVKIYEIAWSKEHFSENLSRFYGKKLPRGCKKIRECGTDPFLLVLVYDNEPLYVKGINIHISYYKSHYRKLTGGGYLVHGCDNISEADENLIFLLGKNTQRLTEELTSQWDGKTIFLTKDLCGTEGWKDIDELNEIITQLPNTSLNIEAGIKHITTSNLNQTCRILNAKRAYPFIKRNWYTVNIGGKKEKVKIIQKVI